MSWPALQQISQPLIVPSTDYLYHQRLQQYSTVQPSLYPGGYQQPWWVVPNATPPPLPYDITPPPNNGTGVVRYNFPDWWGNQYTQTMYYGDPSAAGGLCRRPCQSEPDPAQCCSLKAQLGQCKDADCAGGTFTSPRTSSAPQLVGADCMGWTPCAVYPNKEQCCASKPPGCDPACGPVNSLTPTYPKSGDCRDWPSCAASPNPAMCCAMKAPGCDPVCGLNGVGAYGYGGYGGLAPGQWQVPYDGSTFNETVDRAVDDVYGLDAPSVSQQAEEAFDEV